ncbi:MAG: RHS repeat-associated core domain-containing protein [Prosthecobacter sp.]
MKHVLLIKAAFACLFLAFTAFSDVSADADCAHCMKVRAKQVGSGAFSGLDEDPLLTSGLDKVFNVELGKRYSLHFSSATCEGGTISGFEACKLPLFSRTPGEKLWSISSSLWLEGRDGTQCPPPEPSFCGCEDCSKSAGCSCSCYQPGTAGTSQTIQVVCEYLAWKLETATVNTNVPNFDWEQKLSEVQAEHPTWQFLGIRNPESAVWTLEFKNAEEDALSPVGWDQDNPQQPQTGMPDRFVRWGEATREKTIEIPGTEPVPCSCGQAAPPGPGGAAVSTSLEMFVWRPNTSNTCDPGAGNFAGPSMMSPSFGGGGGGEAPGVPMDIEFGLGRNATGGNDSIYRFSTALDSSNPLAPGNFELLMPFYEPEPGTDPPVLVSGPHGDVVRRLTSFEVIVDELRPSLTEVKLLFTDPATGNLLATHQLIQLPETASSLPGIRYSIQRNGQTQVAEYYGKTTPSGGRMWREVRPDGTYEEGLEQPYVAGQDERLVSHTSGKRVNNADVVLKGITETYQSFSFGERLVRREQLDGEGGTLATTYAYYGADAGILAGRRKWQLNPNGSWERWEYDASGAHFRTLHPWLNSVSNPENATYANSAATTYLQVGLQESWEIESVLGVVTTRNWIRRRTDQLDPLLMATEYGWKTPFWTLRLPAYLHQGEMQASGRQLGLSRNEDGAPVTDVSEAAYGGNLTLALRAYTGQQVDYNSTANLWEIRSKKPPAAFRISSKSVAQATPASIKVDCDAWLPNVGESLEVRVSPVAIPGSEETVYSFTVDGSSLPNSTSTPAESAQYLRDVLLYNGSNYFDVITGGDDPQAWVSVATKEAGAGQHLTMIANGGTSFIPRAMAAQGTDTTIIWTQLDTGAWVSELQDWEATLGVTGNQPGGHVYAVSTTAQPAQKMLLSAHGGKIDAALSALLNQPCLYVPATQKLRQRGLYQPEAFTVWKQVQTPAYPPTPYQPPTPATLSITCDVPFSGDTVTLDIGSIPMTFTVSTENSAEEVAAGLAASIQATYPEIAYASLSGSTVDIHTNATGTSAYIHLDAPSSNVGTFPVGAVLDSYGADAVAAHPGWPAGSTWSSVATSGWTPVPTASPVQTPSPLGSLTPFNGSFNTVMEQRFTADYNTWDGRLELRNATSVEGVQGALRRVVDSTGKVTLYEYDQGTFIAGVFDWAPLTGQAVKKTTRTYAADPASFVLLAQDPVSTVTMSDYQGQTRVEQTWKDNSKVLERTHEYNTQTRDRLWTKEGTVKIYQAERDTVANTLTETDASGTQTQLTFGADGRVLSSAKLGHGIRPAIVTTIEEHELTTTRSSTAGGLKIATSSTRDILGRVKSFTNENGFTTTYAYELGGLKTVETRPDGSTYITENYLDGRLKSVSGTGVVAEYHTYAVDADGNLSHTVYHNDNGSGATRSARWESTTANALGWVLAESRPAPPGAGTPRPALTTRHFYNAKGQRIRTEQPGTPDTLISYDEFGRQTRQGLDVNGNHQLELAGVAREPVMSSSTTYEQQGGYWFEKTTTTMTTSSSTLPRTSISMSLLGGALRDSSIQYTNDGLVTTSVTLANPTTKTVTTTTTTNRGLASQAASRTIVNGLLVSETVPGATGTILYDYDELERPTLVKDIQGVQRKTIYADGSDGTATLARSLVWKEQMQNVQDNSFVTESEYSYHATSGEAGFGRVSTVLLADGKTRAYSYNLHGNQIFVGGTASYPARYIYNSFGELEQMHTYHSGTPTTTSDGNVTTWTYDDATGVLVSKTDNAGKGVGITYTPATGRVWKRTLARKTAANADIIITNGYDDAGRLTSVSYSDGTPSVAHTYHADGQLATTTDAAGLHTYSYDASSGQRSGETITGSGLLSGSSWSTTFVPNQNVRDVLTWNWTGVGSRSIDHDYDSAGRLSKVTAFGKSATYGYDAVTGRKETLTYSGAGLTGTWAYDTKGRLDWTKWQVGSSVISKHDYGFDEMHRRTSAERETGETWRYGYNDRGEVKEAVKLVGNTINASAKRGLQYGYAYDLMGNRTMSAHHTPQSESIGTSLEEVAWDANSLNQVESRGHPGSQWVFGHVKSAATLAVQGGGTVLHAGEEFAVPVTRSGAATAADWHSVDVTATLAGAGRLKSDGSGDHMDVKARRDGHVWFPSSPESFHYDDDGNLTQDGRWDFTWDAENRLSSAETRAAVATSTSMPRMRLEFAYDAVGRRIRKVVRVHQAGLGGAPDTWKLKSDLRFLYDGWNLLAEIEMVPGTEFSTTPQASLVRSYAWGTDLSERPQLAGGVGGLLLVQDGGTGDLVQAPCYDGNGNISAYVKVQAGTVTSRHDYDAFGHPMWNELEGTAGRQVAASPFGFSTKYADTETGLCYYGYRYYSSELGRWISRDRIGEEGGINLYAMVHNAPSMNVDVLGNKQFYVWTMVSFNIYRNDSSGGDILYDEVREFWSKMHSFTFKCECLGKKGRLVEHVEEEYEEYFYGYEAHLNARNVPNWMKGSLRPVVRQYGKNDERYSDAQYKNDADLVMASDENIEYENYIMFEVDGGFAGSKMAQANVDWKGVAASVLGAFVPGGDNLGNVELEGGPEYGGSDIMARYNVKYKVHCDRSDKAHFEQVRQLKRTSANFKIDAIQPTMVQ